MTPPSVSRRVGPYLIQREVARGGMGTVFLAEDTTLRRPVAIKIMSRDLMHEKDAIIRFEREARAAAAVLHKNIAMIFLVGLADDGSPFMAMEFIDGQSLSEVIKSRVRYPISVCADLMMQAGDGLRAARKQGVIHRDVKPANIMVTQDGTVKVVDFGLAKIFTEDSYKTVEGMVMGTPRYMSPEQGQGRQVDHRADIYSLGACFYHLLVGRPPFEADTPVQLMLKHVTAPLVPMRSLVPDIPIELDEVISRCMAKDPNLRYQEYDDLISDLSRIKLQSLAREQGPLVNSLHDMPTVRTDSRGVPLPPRSGSRTSTSVPREPLPAPDPEAAPEEEKGPWWRTAVLVGIAGLIGLAIIIAFISPSKPKPVQKSETGSRIVRALQNLADAGVQKDPDVTPNYREYRKTIDILEALGRAARRYRDGAQEVPEDLHDLTKPGADYLDATLPLDETGMPLDGWGHAFEYERLNNKIISYGMDATLHTGDDFVFDIDGRLEYSRDAYKILDEAELARLSGRRTK